MPPRISTARADRTAALLLLQVPVILARPVDHIGVCCVTDYATAKGHDGAHLGEESAARRPIQM